MTTRTFKCTWCKERFESSLTEIRQWTSRFHSKQCRLNYARSKVRQAKDKQKLSQAKKRSKKANSISVLSKKCDILWSQVVRLIWKCEYTWCNKTDNLNAHHIFWRKNRRLRWQLTNWICLCPSHHKFDSKLSAHEAPLSFNKWLRTYKWDNYIDTLTSQSSEIFKVTSEYLQDTIKEFKQILTNNKD